MKNTGRYANECPEEETVKTSNKKGSSLLIYNNNRHDSSSDEEDHNYGMGNNLKNIHTIIEGNNEEEKKFTESDSDDKEESTDGDDDNTTISEDDEYDRFAFLQEDIVCSNHDKAAIPKNWILLDSQSTVDVFSNKKLITNIRESKRVLTLHCNAGKVSVTQKGDLRGYGTVWYYPESIANILSLYNVQKEHRITFDSADGTRFTVHKEDGSTHVFKPSKKGYSSLMLKVT